MVAGLTATWRRPKVAWFNRRPAAVHLVRHHYRPRLAGVHPVRRPRHPVGAHLHRPGAYHRRREADRLHPVVVHQEGVRPAACCRDHPEAGPAGVPRQGPAVAAGDAPSATDRDTTAGHDNSCPNTSRSRT
jgi:hypothetical protein